jgi:hypothetical protein
MKRLKQLFEQVHQRHGSRGSALLVSLMVMVGLSLLGLSFVAISETETAIAGHQRDSQQALDVAESAAKGCTEWFQDPNWSLNTAGILPANKAAFKNTRKITGYNDVYKPNATTLLFDKPFKGSLDNRFMGTQDYPDVLIDDSTSDGRTFLDTFNSTLFPVQEGGSGQNPRVTEIRVFAPPIIGATIRNSTNGGIGAGDYEGGVRYGLATIQVTAQKFTPSDAADNTTPSSRALASRAVQVIVSEWPFPGPEGPIQSNANIQTTGNFGVHWGRMTSEGDMTIKLPHVGLNWYDAWDHAHYEHGYDSSDPWQGGKAYALGDIVHPSTGAGNVAFVCTQAGTSAAAASEPAWPTTPVLPPTAQTVITDNTVKWTPGTAAMMFPNQSAGGEDQFAWFYELLNQTYDDPWFESRARGLITNILGGAGAGPHPYAYTDPTAVPTNLPYPGYSNWLQLQTKSDPRPSDYKQVIFPKIDYDFWKDIAVSGMGNQGVYYLRWVSADQFTDGVSTHGMAHWVNTVTGAPSGFFFFDTQNQQNPQGPGAPGVLTPAITVNSSDDGPTLQAQGFIYLNAGFGTKGIGGVTRYYNTPGEQFRDLGYRKVAVATASAAPLAIPPTLAQVAGTIYNGDGGNVPPFQGAGNSNWDFQDLPWSNSGKEPLTTAGAETATATNNQFDLYLKQKTVTLKQGGSSTFWVPVEWYPGCHPGDNVTLDALNGGTPDPLGCSEPHEPYMNFQWTASSGITSKGSNIVTGWYAPGSEVRLAKVTTGTTPSPVTCTSSSTQANCSGNGYDRDGPLVHDISPVLEGIFYIQGDFDYTTGNAEYFGSLLINGNVGKAGTPDVWFDEKLVKDEWPPSTYNFPRVYISAIKTD